MTICFCCFTAGYSAGTPSTQELLSAGVSTYEGEVPMDTASNEEDLSRLLSKQLVNGTGTESNPDPAHPLVSLGSGLTALPGGQDTSQ